MFSKKYNRQIIRWTPLFIGVLFLNSPLHSKTINDEVLKKSLIEEINNYRIQQSKTNRKTYPYFIYNDTLESIARSYLNSEIDKKVEYDLIFLYEEGWHKNLSETTGKHVHMQYYAAIKGYSKVVQANRFSCFPESNNTFTNDFIQSFSAVISQPEFTEVGMVRDGTEYFVCFGGCLEAYMNIWDKAWGFDVSNGKASLHTEVDKKYILNLVNSLRKTGCKCGHEVMPPVPPVQWHKKLEVSAQAHTNDMFSNDFFGHGGSRYISAFSHNISTVLFPDFPLELFENTAMGPSTEVAVFNGWKESPGHCENMMNPNHKYMGVSRTDEYWAMHLSSGDLYKLEEGTNPFTEAKERTANIFAKARQMAINYRILEENELKIKRKEVQKEEFTSQLPSVFFEKKLDVFLPYDKKVQNYVFTDIDELERYAAFVNEPIFYAVSVSGVIGDMSLTQWVDSVKKANGKSFYYADYSKIIFTVNDSLCRVTLIQPMHDIVDIYNSRVEGFKVSKNNGLMKLASLLALNENESKTLIESQRKRLTTFKKIEEYVIEDSDIQDFEQLFISIEAKYPKCNLFNKKYTSIGYSKAGNKWVVVIGHLR